MPKMLQRVRPVKEFLASNHPLVMGAECVAMGGSWSAAWAAGFTPSTVSAASFVTLATGFRLGASIRDFLSEISPDDELARLDTSLFAIHQLVMYGSTRQNNDDEKMRLCIHIEENDEWIQHTDYVGPKHRTGRGRKQTTAKGIVGWVFRNKRPYFVGAETPAAKKSLFTTSFGYSESEVSDRNADAWSWGAVPIGEPDHIHAVLYCDANKHDFFGSSGSFRQRVLTTSVAGIAEYLDRARMVERGKG